MSKLLLKLKTYKYKYVIAVIFAIAVIGILSFALPAIGKFKQASSAICTTCHTTVDLTVDIYSDNNATVPLSNSQTIPAGQTLTFYIKVSGEPLKGGVGQKIGAGIQYPNNATPLGSNGNQTDANTWTAYTPAGIMLQNNATFAWNGKNVNMTKDSRTVADDVNDNDNNGYEIFPIVLNVPPTAPPGDYVINVYGAGTNAHGGELATPITMTVTDTEPPNQITNLNVTYDNSTTTMKLNWTTPNPPDNSGSISKFKIYRNTTPIYTLTDPGLTVVAQPTTGLTGGTANTYSDNVTSFANGTEIYYAVTAVDASGNESAISTGSKTFDLKGVPGSPTGTMVKPNDGSSIKGTTSLIANATDDVTVSSVSFERSPTVDFATPTTIGAASMTSGSVTNGQWSYSWNTAIGDGTYYIRAKVTDNNTPTNNVSYSNVIKIGIDNTAPTAISMSAPVNSATLQNVVTLLANNAQDAIGVSRVDFEESSSAAFTTYSTYTGATMTAGTSTNGTWSLIWSSNEVSNGTIYIRARAYDAAGNNTASTYFTYVVNNTADAVPHGNYKTNTTASCAKCHSTHNGLNLYLSQNISVNGMCTTCHDGTSAQKVKGFPNAYEHLFIDKSVYCNSCHDPHKSRTDAPTPLLRDVYNAQTTTGVPGDYQLCFNCHNSSAGTGWVLSSFNIYQYYSKISNAGAGTRGVDKGHYIFSAAGTYKFEDGTTSVPQNYQLRCNDCHDKHGTSNKKLLRTFVGDNPNPITLNDSSTTDLTVNEERAFCKGCHNGNTHLYTTNDTNTIMWDEALSAGHTNSALKCTTCHGGALASPMLGAHTPSNGESSGNQNCINCHSNITSVTTTSDTNDHHVAINFAFDSTKYTQNQSCLQCHVDHNLFRPDIKTGAKRGSNLRNYFGDNPDSFTFSGTSIPANTDFIGKATAPWNDTTYSNNGGLCISCHYQSKSISYTSRAGYNTAPLSKLSTPTAADAATQFDASKHNFTVVTTFNSDNTNFNANCVKCHNDTLAKDVKMQKGPNKFGVHNSSYKSILDPFGATTAGTNPLGPGFCYKCHGNTNNPNYGTSKDFYGVVSMSARSMSLQSMFNDANKHPSSGGTIHQANEGTSTGWNMGGNRHVECDDCHNTHQATNTPGTSLGSDPNNTNWGADGKPHTSDDALSGVLNGVWGVSATNDGVVGSPSTTYTFKQSVGKQYELCLKCHSSYAYNSSPPTSSYPTGGSQPDIGKQFNPNNYAFHPLFQRGRNQPPSNANSNWTGSGLKAATYTDPFNGKTSVSNPNVGLDNTFADGWGTNSIVTCTDCHSADNSSGAANIADGPHGSAVKWILRKADPRVTVSTTGEGVKSLNQNISATVSDTIGKQAALNNLCINCHRADVYGWGTRSYTSNINHGNYSRVTHPPNGQDMGPDGDAGKQGNLIKNGSEAMPGCLNCHGGREAGGIHGSSKGPGANGDAMGKRFTNGASWVSHGLADTSGNVTCQTDSSATSVNSCVKHTSFGSTTISPNYYYTWQSAPPTP